MFKNIPEHLIICSDDATNCNLVNGNQVIVNRSIGTFLPKPLKPYFVFIKYLHQFINMDDIQICLTYMDHTVIRATSITHCITKCSLPLFRIDLKVDNNNKILSIYLLFQNKI